MKGDISSSPENPKKVLGLNLASSQRQKEDPVPSDMSFYLTPLVNFLCRRDVIFPIKIILAFFGREAATISWIVSSMII